MLGCGNLKRKKKGNSFKALLFIAILFFCFSSASAAQWEVGSGNMFT